MEATTSAEALRRQRAALGGSATTRACAREPKGVPPPLRTTAPFGQMGEEARMTRDALAMLRPDLAPAWLRQKEVCVNAG